jgi:hypothetical protein
MIAAPCQCASCVAEPGVADEAGRFTCIQCDMVCWVLEGSG